MNSEVMAVKQNIISKINEIVEKFSAYEIKTEEGKVQRDELIDMINKFLECYSSAELSMVDTRTILDPLLYVMRERLIGINGDRDSLGLINIISDVHLPMCEEIDAWYKRVLIEVPEKIVETGTVDKEALKEHIELVNYVWSRFGEIDTTMDQMVRLVKWVGMQPEIAKQFQMTKDTEGYDDFVYRYFTIPGRNM